MGTRGSSGIIYNEKTYLSYNHFDSYPSELGKNVLNLISKINIKEGWDHFKEKVSKLKEIKEKEITDQLIIEKYKKYSDLSVSDKKLSNPYCLFRNLQGSEWINEVYNGNLEDYKFDNKFVKDSLFCEYAYIINLDTMKLEFYDGFQKIPQAGNRFGQSHDEDGYYPVRLVSVFNLLEIRDSVDIGDIIEKMNNICETKTDDPVVINYLRKPKLQEIKKVAE